MLLQVKIGSDQLVQQIKKLKCSLILFLLQKVSDT